MSMTMRIEYVIWGRESFISREIADNEEFILQAKKINEEMLHRDGVFGEIKHNLIDKSDLHPVLYLHSSGKKFIKEVQDV